MEVRQNGLRSYANTGSVIQKNADFLLEAKPSKAEIAILYNPENQIFAWDSTGNEKNSTDSILGIHRSLYEHNYIVDFIHPREFPSVLQNYKVLILPFPYLFNEQITSVIEEWVRNGGVLISESYTAASNREKGRHEKIVPGYELHKVFGSDSRPVNLQVKKEKLRSLLRRIYRSFKKGTSVIGSIVKETLKPRSIYSG